MGTKNIKTQHIRAMFIMVILTMVFSLGFVAYATPVAAESKEPIGDRIKLNYGGWITFPEGEPFHVMHGWVQTSEDVAIGIYDFQIEIDGIPRIEDFKDFWAESGDPDILNRHWVFNFPEGMTGEHTFTGHWFAPCQAAVDSLGYPGPCQTPNEKVETYSSTLTVLFTTDTPEMSLRVNYGHDWVESFYQTGHDVLITVTDPDGNVKATANLVTEQKGYWGGEPGFQTMDSVWFDGEGNVMEYPPDIQPYDFVNAEVLDNGIFAQVQIGEIFGQVSYQTDDITGSIEASWISDPVPVECLDWGSGEDPSYNNKDGGSILTNGSDSYYCSWAGEWNIQAYQDIGVGYLGPDGHWVANAFTTPFPRIVASEAGDWFWVTEFYPGSLEVFIYETDEVGAAKLWSDQVEATDLWGITYIGPDIHGKDLQPGNYLVISDGVTEKGLVLEPITIHMFNTLDDFMAGTAPLNRDVLVGAGLQDHQETIWVTADEEIPDNPGTGGWLANFLGIVDITEDMRTWSWAQIFDEDWDANEGSNPPTPEIRAWVASNRVEGYQWPLESEITLFINDFENPIDTQEVTEGDENWTRIEFDLGGWVLEAGQEIWMIGGGTEKFHTILPVSITEVNTENNTVYGTSSHGGYIILCIYDGGCDPPAEIPDEDEDGFWTMEYGDTFYIYPGYGMDATEFDGDGDGTSFEYWVP